MACLVLDVFVDARMENRWLTHSRTRLTQLIGSFPHEVAHCYTKLARSEGHYATLPLNTLLLTATSLTDSLAHALTYPSLTRSRLCSLNHWRTACLSRSVAHWLSHSFTHSVTR